MYARRYWRFHAGRRRIAYSLVSRRTHIRGFRKSARDGEIGQHMPAFRAVDEMQKKRTMESAAIGKRNATFLLFFTRLLQA
jgi:hypothetical protein